MVTMRSREHLIAVGHGNHSRPVTRWRAYTYTSLPTFEPGHVLMQDLSRSFPPYVLRSLLLEITFAPESTFSCLMYVRNLCPCSTLHSEPVDFGTANGRKFSWAWFNLTYETLVTKTAEDCPAIVNTKRRIHASQEGPLRVQPLLRDWRYPTHFFHKVPSSLAVLRSVAMAH